MFAGALSMGLAPLISAPLAILTLILLTGGLHEDGLAASADAHVRDRRRRFIRPTTFSI